jgi:hypothetical protein
MKKDKRDQNGFSRRDFIKTTATGASAAAVKSTAHKPDVTDR